MYEDLIILFAAHEPDLSHRDREMRFVGLSPYLRNSPKDRTLGLGWMDAGALIERVIIVAAADSRWSLGNMEQEDLQRLTKQWDWLSGPNSEF